MISTLLDNDFYQFTMSAVVWKNWKERRVRYEFRNRTFAVPLLDCIDEHELRAVIDKTRELRFTRTDIKYLESTGLFEPEFLAELPDVRLPPVEIENVNGHLRMEYEGLWWHAIYWETILLAIVSELYYRRFNALNVEGQRRLDAKIKYLHENPKIEQLIEFGTRRRYSASWQETALERMILHVPDRVAGTSNVHLAHEFGLKPIGSMAHQLFMVIAAIEINENDDGNGESVHLVRSQERVLKAWEAMYGDEMPLIALPDTYTSSFFLSHFPTTYAHRWKGFRQDSGDPFEIGEQYIEYWRLNDVDPQTKTLIFSDGLDLRSMSLLVDRFRARLESMPFGWGTNWTNDLGFESLSIVIKPKAVMDEDGAVWPCVKISDNIAKATGDKTEIKHYLEIIGPHAMLADVAPRY